VTGDSPAALQAARTLAGAAGALALAHSLGASRGPVDAVLALLAGVLGFPSPLYPDKVPLDPERPLEIELPDLSAWDPDTTEEHIRASRCRALLLEIIRRAAHDWILYRLHTKMRLRQVAEDAYTWLFEEGPGHAWHRARKLSGHTITSFLTICDLLDLDPKFVRERIRGMTAQQIMTAGRPAERRHRRQADEGQCVEHGVEVDLDDLESAPTCSSAYEAHFSLG